LTDQEQLILDSLQRQYDTLHGKLPDLLAPATGCSPEQKVQFANSVNQALLNLVNAQNSLLGHEEALIQRIGADVQKAELAIQAALSSLANISQSIDQMARAVNSVTTVLNLLAP